MAVITTGNHPASTWPGVRENFGMKYAEKPMQYTQIFEVVQSSRAYEEDVANSGFGLAAVKSEGGGVIYDSDTQEWTKRYTHLAYALGFIVTTEELADNLYKDKAFRRSANLARSMRQTQEITAANVLNRADSSSYLGGDGVKLLSTAHPALSGNYANALAVAADLSEASAEDMMILIRAAKDSRGLRIALQPQQLIIPPNEMFNADRIFNSALRSGTADNDKNAIRGKLPGGVVINDYLDDTDQWFIQTDCPNGLIFMNRASVELSNDGDFDTMNAKAKAYMRFSVGWTDPRGIYGSPGA